MFFNIHWNILNSSVKPTVFGPNLSFEADPPQILSPCPLQEGCSEYAKFSFYMNKKLGVKQGGSTIVAADGAFKLF